MKASHAIKTRLLFAICLFLATQAGRAIAEERDADEGRGGAVYVMNNEAGDNIIVKLNRDKDGLLTRAGEYATGGLGSGPAPLPVRFGGPGPGPLPLDSQDSLISARNGKYLIAVNAGSNDISVMAVKKDGLELVSKGRSGGIYPVSIAYHDGLVYVINLGGAPTLDDSPGIPTMTGFRLDEDGKLDPIPGSTRVIGPFGSGPADAVFSPDGRFLVVAVRVTSILAVYPMNEDDLPEEPVLSPSSNSDPFGMEFTRNGVLVVTEGVDQGPRNPKPNGSTTSSYRVRDDGTLETISAAVPTNQTAACWVRFSRNQKEAYVVNSGSGTISTFTISPRGELTLLLKAAGNAGTFGAPIDEAITPDGKFLYVDSPLLHSLRGFRVEKDGSLTPITHVEGFPVSFSGIVAF